MPVTDGNGKTQAPRSSRKSAAGDSSPSTAPELATADQRSISQLIDAGVILPRQLLRYQRMLGHQPAQPHRQEDRAGEGKEKEGEKRQAGDSGGQGDERPNHSHQTAGEHGGITVAHEPTIRPVNILNRNALVPSIPIQYRPRNRSA